MGRETGRLLMASFVTVGALRFGLLRAGLLGIVAVDGAVDD